MHNHKRKPSNYDANVCIANDLLPRLVAAVANARDCPSISHLRKEMLSKFVDGNTAPAELRRSRAIEKWLKTEEVNAETNSRLELSPRDSFIIPGVRLDKFQQFVVGLVAKIIGEVPPMDRLNGFSGGATTSRPRLRSYPAEKYVGRADITEDALPLWFEEFCSSYILTTSPSVIVPNVRKGNVMFTVPKNSDIDRVACKEPDLNMFMQRGVGNFIRHQLRRHGIDLNDQSRNRHLAQAGSAFGHLATLDLSAASDSVTTGLCELLLPDLWYSLLMQLRSPFTLVEGDWHENEMMSSMGNGFTFELESLLFYVVARATAYFKGIKGVISVYGDDIIVPVELADDLVSVLSFLGFTVNPKKSFSTGPFRESCGGHFYSGYDITPFYVRGPITRLTDIILLGNQIRRWSDSGFGILHDDLYEVWRECQKLVPERFWGGRDVNSKEALVTPHEPRKRLVAITTPHGSIHYGDYAFSLHQGASTRGRLRATGRYRPGVNKAILCPIPLFLEEVSAT